MNQRNMHAPRRVDTRWPQTQMLVQARSIKRRRFDAFEVSALVALVIGVAVLIGMLTGVL